ncbi:MAG: cysteine hydrolase [Myxococcales bacterium]|nr:cysteine hydrolase [Myxococcales bacterium]
MHPSLVDPKAAALVVMDYQTAVVEMTTPTPDDLLARTASLLADARAAGVRVIYVVVGYRDGYPEVGPHSPTFGPVRDGGRFAEGAPGTAVHAALAPRPGDVVVTKRRVSAFFGTDLDLILRANGTKTLILAGIATSGVVLSTVRHATDADYRVVVVEDCCADRDAEIHRVLMERVFARWTTVVKAADVFAPAARGDR